MSRFQRGDLVVVDLDPTLGHEKTKRRPCVVVSGGDYNRRSSMAVVCPVTSTVSSWPFLVPFEAGSVSGSIMVDQVRAIDATARNLAKVRGVSRVPPAVLNEVQALLEALLLN
jgi:mRNA interferase MazF